MLGLLWDLTIGVSQVQLQHKQGPDHLRWQLEASYGEQWAEIGNKRFLRISQTLRNDSGPALRNYFLEVSLPPEQSHDLAKQPRWMWGCRTFPNVPLGSGCRDVCRDQAWWCPLPIPDPCPLCRLCQGWHVPHAVFTPDLL